MFWKGNRLDSIISYSNQDELHRREINTYENEMLQSTVTIEINTKDTIVEKFAYNEDGTVLSSFRTSTALKDSTYTTFNYDHLKETKITLRYDESDTIVWGRKQVTVTMDDNKSIDSLYTFSWDVSKGEFSNTYWLQNNFYTQLTSSTDHSSLQARTFTIHPNPTSEVIYLSNDSPVSYSIHSISGSHLATNICLPGRGIDVASLLPGNYILRIHHENTSIKFVKL